MTEELCKNPRDPGPPHAHKSKPRELHKSQCLHAAFLTERCAPVCITAGGRRARSDPARNARGFPAHPSDRKSKCTRAPALRIDNDAAGANQINDADRWMLRRRNYEWMQECTHACMKTTNKKIQPAGEPQGGGREKMKKGRLSREEKEYEGQIE